LARSRSGDDLWDLTQCSLRIHGELHNNLRMTWAKSIPFWRPTAQSALEALIALNHRYALDGSDPNSYGGLLWTLGLFDRPFPDSRVLGRLRSRSTKDHARRLDLNRYRSRVMRPSTGNPVRVAVIGAGISGLTAARTLQDQGHEVQVFEKARGSGGRSATRRDAQWHFDHGAQYFTVRDPRFRQAVAAWREQGLVKPWPLRSGRVVRGEIRESSNDRERFVAVPGMSALARHLGADLNLRTGTRVTPPSRNAGRWRLRDPDGEDLGSFDRLIVSAPAPQAQALMAPIAPGLAAQAGAVQYDPTWAVMLGIASEDHPATNGLFFDDGPLSWAAENASKPGRSGHTWVLHASAEWTRMHLDATAQQVADALADYFCRVTGFPPHSIAYRSAHRWLYARVSNPLEADALWDPELGLGACGDWCREARIEGAFLSGQAVAGRLLGDLGRTAELARDRGNRPDIARP
jgi:predicted NAD/FAD-dependent oxidoreductase